MTTLGLEEVKNPSELFLAERRNDITGSTIFPSLEGTRPILVEIQSLVSNSNFSAPQRNVNGFDFKIFYDNEFKNEFVSTGSTDTFVFAGIGTIGVTTTASATQK